MWDQGIPGRAYQAELVIIVLQDPTRFPNWKQYPLKREAWEGLQPLINSLLVGYWFPPVCYVHPNPLSKEKKDGTW